MGVRREEISFQWLLTLIFNRRLHFQGHFINENSRGRHSLESELYLQHHSQFSGWSSDTSNIIRMPSVGLLQIPGPPFEGFTSSIFNPANEGLDVFNWDHLDRAWNLRFYSCTTWGLLWGLTTRQSIGGDIAISHTVPHWTLFANISVHFVELPPPNSSITYRGACSHSESSPITSGLIYMIGPFK